MKQDTEKYILDACCGCRQMWFDKNDKNTVFMDAKNCGYKVEVNENVTLKSVE